MLKDEHVDMEFVDFGCDLMIFNFSAKPGSCFVEEHEITRFDPNLPLPCLKLCLPPV